jgi:hypothetical protein
MGSREVRVLEDFAGGTFHTLEKVMSKPELENKQKVARK